MLGAAGSIEYALQLLLPVVLARTLTQQDFGDYRLIWLLAGTALAIFPLSVPQTLFHFLPRATDKERPSLVGNALVFVIFAGALAAGLLLLTWSWLPPAIRALERYSYLVPVFLALWVMGSLVSVLPNADGNARWQALCIAGLAIGRAIALSLAAILSRDIAVLILVMCVFAFTRTILAPIYAYSGASTRGLSFRPSLLGRQVRYSLLFAAGNTLFLLRMQAEQWIVASLFDASVFALISIAAVSTSISTLIRRPLNNATLPKLSILIGEGRLEEARALQSRAFSALTLLLLPVIAMLIVAAFDLVELMYTSAYLGAAPLMQIYLFGQMTGIYATGHLLVILNAGRLATTISAVGLVLSVILSLAGVHWIGLPGAVAGSVTSLIIGEAWALVAVSRLLGTRTTGLLDWRIISRTAAVVACAALVSSLARYELFSETNIVIRLFATITSFVLVIGIGAIATGLHKDALSLIGGLFQKKANSSR